MNSLTTYAKAFDFVEVNSTFYTHPSFEILVPSLHICFELRGAVASAESCAKKGDGSGALEYLSKAGKWAIDVATTIGVPVATEALKKVIGL